MVSAEVCAFCLKALSRWQPPSRVNDSDRIVVKPINLTVPISITEAIPKAKNCILAKTKDLCFDYHVFPQFGKQRLKELKIHPDAFVQVVIQAAVYMTHRRYDFIELGIKVILVQFKLRLYGLQRASHLRNGYYEAILSWPN